MKRSVAWSSLVPLCAVLLLGGCNKQGPEPPHVPVDDAAADGSVDGALPRAPLPEPPPLPEAAPNAVAVGSALGANGAVQSPKRAYAVADTVYASVPTAGRTPGDSVTVYWTHEDGGVDKEET